MSETVDPKLSSHGQTSEKSAKNLGYKGSVSGLKGLLSSRIAEGLATVVNGIDKVGEMVQANVSGSEIGTTKIPIEQIYPCPDQPRQVFEPKALEELSHTLKEIGQAQAITVRKTSQGYEIISGERRYRAAKLAGFSHLDCVVKEVTRTEGRLLALVENTQRQDLLPIEEAEFLKKVLDENPQMSLEKLAKQLGSHKSTISEKIQLCEMPDEFKQHLFSNAKFFTHRHWRIVSRISDIQLLRQTVEQAFSEHLSVAELERAVSGLSKNFLKSSNKKKKKDAESENLDEFQNLIRVDGKYLKIKSLSVNLDTLAPAQKKALISAIEASLYDLKKDPSVVTVSNFEPMIESVLFVQKPSIEI